MNPQSGLYSTEPQGQVKAMIPAAETSWDGDSRSSQNRKEPSGLQGSFAVWATVPTW